MRTCENLGLVKFSGRVRIESDWVPLGVRHRPERIIRHCFEPRVGPSRRITARLVSSRRASLPTQRGVGCAETARRRATVTAASFRAELRRPIARKAQLTAFLTKLR